MGGYSKGPEGVEINKGISDKDTKGVYLDRRLERGGKQARADGLGASQLVLIRLFHVLRHLKYVLSRGVGGGVFFFF